MRDNLFRSHNGLLALLKSEHQILDQIIFLLWRGLCVLEYLQFLFHCLKISVIFLLLFLHHGFNSCWNTFLNNSWLLSFSNCCRRLLRCLSRSMWSLSGCNFIYRFGYMISRFLVFRFWNYICSLCMLCNFGSNLCWLWCLQYRRFSIIMRIRICWLTFWWLLLNCWLCYRLSCWLGYWLSDGLDYGLRHWWLCDWLSYRRFGSTHFISLSSLNFFLN